MKVLKYLLLCVCFCVLPVNAQQSLNWHVGIVKPTAGGVPFPKAPVLLPQVEMDDGTLYFIGTHSDYTLCLLDENENVVYTTYIPASVSSLALPSYLSGYYEIRLLTDSVYFYGYIIL